MTRQQRDNLLLFILSDIICCQPNIQCDISRIGQTLVIEWEIMDAQKTVRLLRELMPNSINYQNVRYTTPKTE